MEQLRIYLRESRRWENAVLLVVPLLALYEIGLLLTSVPVRNAAEVYLLLGAARLLGAPGIVGREGLLMLNGLVLAAFLFARWSTRKRPVPRGTIPLLLAESLSWALILAPVILGVRGLIRIALRSGDPAATPLESAVLGLGAGLYEELLFRLLLIAGGYVLLVRGLRVDPIWAQVFLVILSALLFSAYHHVGRYAEPYTPASFVFRFLAGVIFGLLYIWRGFAVVCWSHALYDVLVAFADA